MRAPYFTLGSMLLVSSLAACATAPRASMDEAADSAVRESMLDEALRSDCGSERFNRRESVGVPVALVVRPDGTVHPGSVRVTSAVYVRYWSNDEVRRSEASLRSDAVTRVAACTFSPPTRNGQPVHARVQRSIAVPL